MRKLSKNIGVVLGVVLLATGLRAAEKGTAEEQLLRKAGIGTDNGKLLAFVRLRSEAAEDLRNLDALVRRLGHNEFTEREKASAKLIALDRAALPALRRVIADKDAEVARRARTCIAVIERGSPAGLPMAVVRQLLKQHPPGTVAALVGYVPFAADEEVEEVIYFGLEKLVQDKTVDASLLAAVRDPLPGRRRLAACLVGRWGTEAQRRQVSKLLADGDAEVRLRAAQGLLGANDAGGLPALVALLEEPSLPLAWQAEELLHYAAGEQTPKAVLGRGSAAERKACRAAWERWLRDQGRKVDLQARQKLVQRPGLVLVIEGWADSRIDEVPEDYWRNHLWLCGCEGQPRCKAFTYAEFKSAYLSRKNTKSVAFGNNNHSIFENIGLIPREDPWDHGSFRKGKPVRLENGNHVKILHEEEYGSLYRVAEVDVRGRTVWEAAYKEPVCAMILFSLVRVGFARTSRFDMDLDAEWARFCALKHPQAIVRRLAVERLRTFPPKQYICRAVVDALNDTDYDVQGQALSFLAKTPSDEICRGIPNLIKFLGDPNPGRRRSDAARMLYRCGEKAVPALVATFENKTAPNTEARRHDAIMILARLADLPHARLHQALRMAFEDTSSDVRESVSILVANSKPETRNRYIPYIVRRLRDPDPKVVKAAMRGLGECGEAAQVAVPDLIELLKKPAFRDDAICKLGVIGHNDPKSLPAILDQLKPGQNAHSYCCIAFALGEYNGEKEAKSIVPLLITILKEHQEQAIEENVVEALEKIGPAAKAALPYMARLIKPGKDNRNIIRAIKKIESDKVEKKR